MTEGMVSFMKDKSSEYQVDIPQYSTTSKSVYKIYDNMFFDNKNGNFIEINGQSYTNKLDNTGNTISAIAVTPRDGHSTSIYLTQYTNQIMNGNVVTSGSVAKGQDTELSKKTKMEESFTPWTYDTRSTITDNYFVAYIPWADSTYIHVIDKVSPATNIGSYIFGPANTMDSIIHSSSPVNLATGFTAKKDNTDAKNDTIYVDKIYSATRPIYQISKNVCFDMSNGNLIIRDAKMQIYNRMGGNGTADTSKLSESNFNSWIKKDTAGELMVVYMANSTKTVIILIQLINGQYSLFGNGAYLFSKSGLESGFGSKMTESRDYDRDQVGESIEKHVIPTLPAQDDSVTSEYYKWYWKNIVNKPEDHKMSEDYILKTQIVPPVCPSCPSCPSCTSCTSAGTCTNCGGNGGSGTLAPTGTTMVGAATNVSATTGPTVSAVASATPTHKRGNAIERTVDTAGNVIEKTVDTAGNVIEKTVDTAGNVIEKTVDAAGNVVEKTVDAAGNVIEKTVDAAGNVLEKTLGAAGSILSGAERGLGNLLQGTAQGRPTQIKGQGTNQQRSQVYQAPGTQSQPLSDQYSYYGALPSKGDSQYMPVTADFSAFRH